ncbi:unnamed protein product [Phytophthora fragariaefolia]|uniref:Unnamed protein product n=1 Tax=Phytophthora fragariaefolia TaxID=1490495 RepID=A0A9W6TRT0_9STRA|nr:unnamed protein product [Phytophthora fragariaefolia]
MHPRISSRVANPAPFPDSCLKTDGSEVYTASKVTISTLFANISRFHHDIHVSIFHQLLEEQGPVLPMGAHGNEV